MPIAREYRPQLVLISAGFDAALGDPLGGCTVTPAGYAYMMKELMSLAGGRVLLALEGGYNLESISASAVACARIMLDGPDAISTAAVVSGEPRADAAADINTTILALSQVWTSLPTIKRSSARIAAAKSASCASRDRAAHFFTDTLAAVARRRPRHRGQVHGRQRRSPRAPRLLFQRHAEEEQQRESHRRARQRQQKQ